MIAIAGVLLVGSALTLATDRIIRRKLHGAITKIEAAKVAATNARSVSFIQELKPGSDPLALPIERADSPVSGSATMGNAMQGSMSARRTGNGQ